MNRTMALAACVIVSGMLIFIGGSFISLAAPNVTSCLRPDHHGYDLDR